MAVPTLRPCSESQNLHLLDRVSASLLLLHKKAKTEPPKSAFETKEVWPLNLAIYSSL